ncbi:HAMP domain-containing histidine kinase [Bacteroides nordii]|uniref:sensor histidine kinase n=1 Tax=Bacteroides nordii TaxID=291645 RepID=UPI001F1692B4|nr:HAMP domain-containing sensor histidine kinase [Bacteroides nordii]MCE8463537.1 HAMP domain-containing histidine kinase [Bacteroides nordii]MCG4768455.1 HAMP domain-containing histidine kinase [Bacteroides nordii]UYU49036.1 HAMP domain-containing histidine kinase [Bacteroides nordii]
MLPYIRYVFSFLLPIVFLWPVVGYAAQDTRSILIICSYNPAAHQTSVTISDFMDEYTRCGGKYNIEIENMNCKSFSEAPQWKGMMQQILSKYTETQRPELIILLGQEAWASYLSQEDSLVAQIPVMCSLTSRNAVILPEDTINLKEWMPESVDFVSDDLGHHKVRAGFVYEYDIEGNIQLLKHLYPDTRHIAFISDNTYGGVAMQALVREKMKKFPEMDLILLDGRSNTIYTILDKFQKLPENTAVMVGTWRVDMNESYFMRNATYMMMEANPTVPAFTPASIGLGYWAVGGVIPAYRPFGREMAREAIRLLDNPKDTVSHVEIVGSKAVLDYKKVKDLKLDIKSLPFHVEIVGKPVSFYQLYMYQIWAAISIFVILVGGLIISLFFYFRTKRLKDDLQRSEVDLREAKDRAEESNRLKSAFLANMSHEIRTPLNAIVGFSDVLTAEGSSDEDRKGYSEIIKSNSDLLLRLINDILDLSRLDADRVRMTKEPCDVVQLCRQVLTSVDFSRKSNNKFVFTSKHEDFVINTDVQRLQQVIINLLSNSAKFTQDGVITLDFSVDEGRKLAFFSVTDTGCGIPKEKQKLVFERFEKLDEYAQGTGLGLSICKLTVEKWGGEIWVDPDYTEGARFVFSMPVI